MSKLTDRTSYLKGLADGMNLSREKDANKLILEMLDVLRDMAAELEALQEDVDDLDEYVASMDEDLTALSDGTGEDDCGCGLHHHGHHHHEPSLFLDDNEADLDEDEVEDHHGHHHPHWGDEIHYACPFCHKELRLSLNEVNFSDHMPCPNCGKPLFPEGLEDEQETEGEEDNVQAVLFEEEDDLTGEADPTQD